MNKNAIMNCVEVYNQAYLLLSRAEGEMETRNKLFYEFPVET